MVTTKHDELFTNGTISVRILWSLFSFTLLGMFNDTFHLLARLHLAVGISTLTRVHQRLNTSLNIQLSRFSRGEDGIVTTRNNVTGSIGHGTWVSTTGAEEIANFIHAVRMPLFVVASGTEIEVVTLSTMISGVQNVSLTLVASVHEATIGT